jgi:mRNA interferase RelE/StbE
VTRYTVYVTPTAWDEVKDLPGNIRQRVRRAITSLEDEPRPAESKALVNPHQEANTAHRQVPGASVADEQSKPARELRRIRLERWRIVYAITEVDQAVDVLTVRKRPPYDYGDLERLLAEI